MPNQNKAGRPPGRLTNRLRVSVTLSPEQVKALRRVAREKRKAPQAFAREMLREVIVRMTERTTTEQEGT